MPEQLQIRKLPVSSIQNYQKTFYVVSSLDPELSRAFINRDLEGILIPPKLFNAHLHTPLHPMGNFFQEYFGFDPKTYLSVEGLLGSSRNKQIPKITKEGIERFMELGKTENSKTVIFTTVSFNECVYYCSANLL